MARPRVQSRRCEKGRLEKIESAFICRMPYGGVPLLARFAYFTAILRVRLPWRIIDAGSKIVNGASDVDAGKIVNVDGLGVVPIQNQLLDARLSFNPTQL